MNITSHIVPGDPSASIITCDGRDKRAGGASHHYSISKADQVFGVHFQHGAVKEAGINGLQDSELMAILIDRFEAFQAGPFACNANARVLEHLESALTVNLQRTRDRVARGVEGQSKA